MNALRKLRLVLLLAAVALALSHASPAVLSQGANPITGSEATQPGVAASQTSEGPSQSDQVVVREVPESEQLTTEQLWTREELLNAKPLSLSEFASSDVTAADGPQTPPEGSPGMAPSALPGSSDSP